MNQENQFSTFYFVAERTAVIRGCTTDQQELVEIRSQSFRRADQWVIENYPGYVTWHTESPQDYLFTCTNFGKFAV